MFLYFLKAVEAQNGDENLILNPTTPQSLLSTLSRGAVGRTYQELCQATNFRDDVEIESTFHSLSRPQDTTNKNELSIANAILVNKGVNLNPQFQQQTNANTFIGSLDFTMEKSIRDINKWASDNTRGTIPQILNPNGQYGDLRMLLASAIYFRGSWKEAFKPAGDKIFNAAQKGRAYSTPFMTIEKNLRYGEIDDRNNQFIASWVELPYSDDKFSMVVIKPQPNVPLRTVIDQLDLAKLLKTDMRVGFSEVNVTMPKFQLKTSSSLVAPLQSMGVVSIFNQGAELPQLIQGEKAQVSNVIQDAFIDVDLEGSKASSVTSISVIQLSAVYPDDTIQFFVDKPFLAIILEKTQNIPLFYAKVTNPKV